MDALTRFAVPGFARYAAVCLCLDERARLPESRYPASPAAGCDAGLGAWLQRPDI
jgi:hypothetical protein